MSKRLNSLYRAIVRLRWPILVIVVGLAAIHQAALFALLDILPPARHNLAQLALYSLTGIVVAWLGLSWLARSIARQEEAEFDLQRAYADLARTHRQLQAIHEVGRRVANASDVQELLEIAARIPVDLLDARGATVITFDEQQARADLEMSWGLNDQAVRAVRQQVLNDFSAQRCANCRPLTAHINQDCPLLGSLRDAGCAGDIERVMCLPLGRDEERMGVISAYLQGDARPSADESKLVSILATEITAALEGVRLRARQMATLYAVDRVMHTRGVSGERRSLNSLLDNVLTTTISGWGAQAGAVLLLEKASGAWNISAHQGLGDDLGSAEFGLALRLAEEARATGQALIFSSPSGYQTLASVVVILLQAEGETLGALFLGADQPETFQSAQAELMMAVASQIALAVRNAQLYSRLRQAAVVEERYRLSREMHDGLAQTLGYLGMQAERLEQLLAAGQEQALKAELKDLRQVIAEAFVDVREAIDGLRLTVGQPGGLVGALRAHVDDFTSRTGLAVEFNSIEEPEDLSPEAALHLLRIAQEALTNVRRHAQANRVWLRLARENSHLELTVADDGQGFDPALPQERHHVGLASMRERVRSLDGQLTLATSPGRGTRVTARLPI